MPTRYTVKPGDCLSSIAARFGFGWRTLYDAPDNAELKKKRPNPNVIFPGDVVVIPDPAPHEVEVSSGSSHKFKLKRKPTLLRLVAAVDEPHKFLLEVAGEELRGTTDGKAPIEMKVDPLALEGTLRLWPDASGAPEDPPDDAVSWTLRIGFLDPVEETSGVKGRLLNLGYYDGPVNGEVDDLTTAAIRRFREDEGLEIKDEIDGELRNKLAKAHDEASA
ncbi:MAG TPA: LysM peptidoglycan-binding domain-containing protein [Myxococcaceae bacterium]|nr:LysM peptidoglycan-binding domain-containing protein [Myxococcaceae bacterium]